MSNNSSSQKTEEPTPKKLRDARKRGQVVKSREVAPVLVFLGILLCFALGSDYFYQHMITLFDYPFLYINQKFQISLNNVMLGMLFEMAYILIPLLAVSFIAALISQLGQIGFLFSGEPIKIEFKKINPVEGFKKIFSVKSLFEFFKSIIKILLLTIILTLLLKSELHQIFQLPYCGLDCLFPYTALLVIYMVAMAAVGMLIIAVLDYFFEKFQHRKQLRMTKDEVKREYKETEGNPEVKGRRRQLHQELQDSEIKNAVQESSLLVTNPTHIAVGLLFERGRTALPFVTLKVKDRQARYAIEVAEAEGIPVLQRVALARGLYADAEQFKFIPREYIDSVAEVIHWAEQVRQNHLPPEHE